MGGNEETNRGTNQEAKRRTTEGFSEYIEFLYDMGLELDLTYQIMYDMDLSELINTIEQRRKGLAYRIWRLASLTRSPYIKDFPEKPEDACKELFPKPKTIAMPDFLKEKYYKQKGVKING